MKTRATVMAEIAVILFLLGGIGSRAAAEPPKLTHTLRVTPEVKRAFHGADGIEIREVTGTDSKFQVGGTYRVVGVCRQGAIKTAQLYIGNTSEPGSASIAAAGSSSLFKVCADGATEFDVTFTLLRPGILHVTIYDLSRKDTTDNAYAGIYLGDVVLRR